MLLCLVAAEMSTGFDDILALVDPDKFDSAAELASTFDWLETYVFPRIEPADGVSLIAYFTDTKHHLDRTVWKGTVKPDGRLMCPHRIPLKRKRRLKSTLHKELHQIFCPRGFECPSNKRLNHRRQYDPTSEERAAGHAVGRTCKCSNWTHVYSDTQRQNMLDKYRIEGGARLYGEANPRTETTNESVADLRAEVWERANAELVGGEQPCTSTTQERSLWAKNDPRWERLTRWRRAHKGWIDAQAELMGVCKRTVQNYCAHRTFRHPHTVRQKFEPTSRSARWRLLQAERRSAFQLAHSIPAPLLTPDCVPSLEQVLGKPDAEERPSPNMVTALIRCVRRRVNASCGHGPGVRRTFVSDGNLSAILSRLDGEIQAQIANDVECWVACTLRIPHRRHK